MEQGFRMHQLSAPLADKLDEPLAQLCNEGFAPQGRVPVLVRCNREAISEIAQQVRELGGSVRHHLRLIGAVAAWLPLNAIEPLARDEGVWRLELEQSFTVA